MHGQGGPGQGEAAQKKRSVGRPRKYGVDGAPPRPAPANWHLDASAFDLLQEIQDATGGRPAKIASRSIEFYYHAKYPNGVPRPRMPGLTTSDLRVTYR